MKSILSFRQPVLTAVCALALGCAMIRAAEPAKPAMKEASGSIKSIDNSHHTLILTESKDHSDHKYQWTEKTSFMDRGKSVTVTQLKLGASVHLMYSPEGGVPTIHRLLVATA